MFKRDEAWVKVCELAWQRCQNLVRQGVMIDRLLRSPAWRQAEMEAYRVRKQSKRGEQPSAVRKGE